MSERTLKIIHIEDEPEAQLLLEKIVTKFIPTATYLTNASTLESGERLIKSTEFDLLFLDLQLPDGNGLDIIKNHPEFAKKTILCTADESKGIEAIKMGIYYYILKPININEIIEVVTKKSNELTDSINSQNQNAELEFNLLENKLILPDQTGIELIPIPSIIRLEASQNYTIVHLVSGTKLTASKTLGYFETLLQKFPFVRIHRSNLVNIDYIKRINKGENGTVELNTGESLKLSESGRSLLKDLLKF